MKQLLLLSVLGGLSILTLNAKDPEAALKNGILTVFSGDYQATFSYGHRWNLSSLNYGDLPIIVPGGANQFTVKTKNDDAEDVWYGGLGNAEDIQSATLYVDEEAYPLDPSGPGENRKFALGDTYAVEKVANVGPYEVTTRTTITSTGVTEKITLSARGDTKGVDLIYPSRFSFSEDFGTWFAILEDGFEEEGDGGRKGSTTLNYWTKGLALYAESNGHVILLQSKQEPKALLPNHFLWNTGNRISFHAKLAPVTAGTVSISRHLSVSAAGQGTDDWRDQLRKSLKEAK